ncbi:IS21 family transposase [Shigella sonnei]|uniref:IS21 family transposase n=1 Tax=Shigella sonnei TaxID=624 RepID=UPI00097306A4|nr:IS21 family transposase [Shigella sonnei]SJK27914.1 Rhs element protein [Shigella sonnei]
METCFKILQLKFDKKLTNRCIGLTLHISASTVFEVLARFKASSLSWPLPADISHDTLEKLIFPPKDTSASELVMPDMLYFDTEMRKPGVTRQLLWMEYKAQAGDKAMGYSHFCRCYRKWKKTRRLSMRQEHRAGEKLFIDFCGPTVPVINPDTGEIRRVAIFVAVMGASNYTYVEACEGQDMMSWLNAHSRCLTFLGGVPKLLIPDNLRSAVKKADRYEPVINDSYQALAEHYGTVIIPARPRKPKDKPKAENGVLTKDYTFKRPGWPGRFDQEGQYQDYQRTQYEVYDYPGRFKGAHGQNFARWQMDGWRNNAEVARGTSRSPEIWPGRRIVLTGHPQANLNREWQVVASDLHGEQPQAVPGRRGSGTTLENHFAVIPADRTWRPQPLMKPLVDGPQSAVVTGPAGEEIFCDEHGRVRVKFNWDRYNPSNQDSSCWIRVAQAWAGTGFGNLAIPRVGQEVIVDFLNGDPDQPIIMGRTYHQENRTPGSLPGTKTQMTIRSKTYKGSGFNELKFDDATGKEQVYIHAQKNMNTEVLNNRTTDVINNHAETIGNNQMIAVTNNQIETVGVNQIETVGSNQIIKVGSVQVETIGLVRALTVGVAYQTTVGGIMNTSVALMQSSQIGLHKSLRVGLGYDVKVGNNVTFTVGKTKKDDTGQTAIYSAGEHLELCCGKARLVLTKDGQIFLNGTKIHLQGKEQVNGDSLLINWNCAASKSPPKTPDEKQDTPDMREY